jgi:hypothetical protein
VAEVDAGFEQFFHGDICQCSSLVKAACGRRLDLSLVREIWFLALPVRARVKRVYFFLRMVCELAFANHAVFLFGFVRHA